MKVNGTLIRELRKSKKYTQKSLCLGICEQATISNIERNGTCSNIHILAKVCNRLNIKVDEIIIEDHELHVKNVLQRVKNLCSISKHAEASIILKDEIEINKVSNLNLLREIHYYLGNTLLISEINLDDSLYHFQRAIDLDHHPDILTSLLKNGLGIYYERVTDNEKALFYYKESIQIARSIEGNPILLNRVFFNAAKFYSLEKKYQEAVFLCDEALEINKKNQSTEILEYILYERAYNSYFLDDDSYIEQYNDALSIARINENIHVIKIIYTDLKEMIHFSASTNLLNYLRYSSQNYQHKNYSN
jgi:tetratricopeptide (TPR) repeat protein